MKPKIDKSIALTLGKLLVAIAWADGELQDEEVQILKDLIHKIPNLTQDDWSSIEVYMESPVTATECAHLMTQFQSLIRSDDDKLFAIQALQDIVYADGVVDEEERKLYDLLVEEIQEASLGFDRKIEDLFQGARSKRRQAMNKVPRRERNIEDFLDNPIFYRSFHKLTEQSVITHMDKAELEKLCVAGALMACIAQADGEIHDNEKDLIQRLLKKYWHLSGDAAMIVSEIAVNQEVAGMDILRMCRKFFNETNAKSRLDFFDLLIALTKSDYYVHASERERLRSIAINLKIPQDTILALMPNMGEISEEEVKSIFDTESDDDSEDGGSSFKDI